MLPKLPEWLGNIVSAVWNFITTNGPTILAKLGEWTGAFLNWVMTDVLPQIPGWLLNIANALWTWISTTAKDLGLKLINEWLPAFWNWITGPDGVIAGIGKKLGEIWTSITTWITTTAKDIFNSVIQIGKNIIDGIVQGLKDAGNAIWDFIQGLINDAIDGIKKFFGISSPSKLMAEEVGEPLALGIATGFENAWDDVVGRIIDKAKEVPSAVRDALPQDQPGSRPGDFPGDGALPQDQPGSRPGDFPGDGSLPQDRRGTGGGGWGGGRVMGATRMGGGDGGGGSWGAGFNVQNIIIYATPGVNGRQVALDFIDGVSEQLGLSERTRRPAVVVR